MDEAEIRMRCIEAAAKTPQVHNDGYAAGVLAAARQYAAWVEHGDAQTMTNVQVIDIVPRDFF